ncbi:hypothetical protein Oweho_0772 [Owenweeksia hongkongensis DSM 17368]|uniref:DUF2268 domain-containing protein n=1 Tax=Owenweeksia hongkongensis (strain DSM 17368 / CIP 108786 / JCM 12287 / NRRL B-23963 / UST20020801) TaxID=926562 RepID=G8R235_OWEHD|nr:hypothetical protein [Owenweeksia hongkongensis]AEV31785.1 hypothetical protein Oweho_0772 [Owenweeksia hongkongensis DSM 17368]
MKNCLIALLFVLAFTSCKNPMPPNKNVITSDITNFWVAYDKITSTQDSALQYQYLDSLYFKKGTIGLEGIRQARNYTPQDYINAINNYPRFWESIRENTLQASDISAELQGGIEKFKQIYPDLKPAKIYFTIGAFRTGGTTIDSLVLIGSEISMTDSSTITSEFPENLSHLQSHFATNPNKHLVFLNVHEYVHTQQNPRVFNILSLTLYEGVAEFVASKALGVSSPNPQIAFGKKHAERIREVYETEMFYNNNLYKWLDGNAPNEFGMRDLGYYVGYQICENYYQQADDKGSAIKTMIELDYTDEAAVEDFVAKSNYFSKPLDVLYQKFEEKRPTVIAIKQFENNSKSVSPDTKEITIEFSRALTGHHTGVDFGDLGQDAFPKGTLEGRRWSDDNLSWTIPVALEPNKQYQILISNNFRTEENIPLKPYLIDFKTSKE